MEFKDYYQILGVDKNAEASAIKAAYRRLARKYHPDVSTEADAESQFKAVAEAYAVLKDADKRAEYDAYCEQRKAAQNRSTFQQSGSGSDWSEQADFSDFFESIFRQSGATNRAGGGYREHPGFRGQDIETTLQVSLEEALLGGSKTISLQLPDASKAKTLKIKIPPATQAGDVIRLKGQGMPGHNKGQAGDIYLRVEYEPHRLFDAEGLDVILTVPVMPWEAALGATVVIPTLTSKLKLTIPANSQSGQRLRLKGKGLKSKTRTGDLFAILKVELPDKNNTEMNQLWQQMAEKCDHNPRSKWRL